MPGPLKLDKKKTAILIIDYQNRMLNELSENSRKEILRKANERLAAMQIIGSSSITRELRNEISRLSRGRRNIVIIGDVGVGKGSLLKQSTRRARMPRSPAFDSIWLSRILAV